MEWFSGTVSEAIRTVRNESRFLLVFVKGADESSERMDQQFDADAAAVCDGVVCLRLEASSEAAMQFSAVYVLLSVPCVYIIAPSGKAVDVKLGGVEKRELHDWIAKHTQNKPVASCSTETTKEPTVSTNDQDNKEQAQTSQSDPPTLDQRVSAAYELMEEKRRARLEEERENARIGEIKRRELGKTMQDFRERQRAREVEEAMAERRKEEVESRLLRERLRQQIEEDRRAFQERSQGITNQIPTDSAPTITESVSRQRTVPTGENDLTRLQLRMIGGGHIIGRFTPTSNLASDVRNWLQQAITVDAQDADSAGEYPNIDDNTRQKLSGLILQGYRFRQLHPPKLFEPEEEVNTMTELGLFPSAVLMLIPTGGRSTSAIQPASGSWTSTFYGLVSGAFGTLYSYTGWLLGGIYSIGSGFISSISPSHTTRQRQSPEGTPSPGPTSSSSSKSRENRAIRRQGNMARLSHLPDDSDDEQARWNGNSTEQL
ncbi:UBX domain-containing protein 4 [Clonorchis sinensis]|uniref:UBX domain-containing protein 4 n=1 Tax=Clonorchis sinensis TaxID=79923 RepID=A0A8T1MUU1_CLOSI|nr:UBX domain-containing protein 4 [Clonorchis sinensis]